MLKWSLNSPIFAILPFYHKFGLVSYFTELNYLLTLIPLLVYKLVQFTEIGGLYCSFLHLSTLRGVYTI